MNFWKKIVLSLSLVYIGMLWMGCASIVKKPEINQVKKVAILSLFGNDRIYREGTTDFTTDWDAQMKEVVARHAYEVFSKEFKKLGWSITSAGSILSSKDYQESFKPPSVNDALGIKKESTIGKAINFLQERREEAMFDKFFALKDMYPIHLSDQAAGSSETSRTTATLDLFGGGGVKTKTELNVKGKLAEMAKKLNVDAVLTVEMRYCYKGGFLSLGGTGQAFLLVESVVKAVDRRGEMIVNMKDIQGCGKDTIESDKGVAMISGKLVFAKLDPESFARMFKDANVKTAQKTVNEIKEAMN